MTERIRKLLGGAIQTAAVLVLRAELTPDDAQRLASFRGVRKAIDRLEERLTTKIEAGPITADGIFQKQLAIAETVLEARGASHEARVSFRQMFKEKAIFAWRCEQSAREDTARLEELRRKLIAAGHAWNDFERRAFRLRGEQIRRLRASLLDAEKCQLVIERLDEVYAHYLETALRLSHHV